MSNDKSKKDFEDHLEDLYEVHGPDVSNLPTSDEILTGIAKPDKSLTFDQKLYLIMACAEDLRQVKNRYEKQNIVFDERLDHFALFFNDEIPEIRVTACQEVLKACGGIEPRKGSPAQEFFDIANKVLLRAMTSQQNT